MSAVRPEGFWGLSQPLIFIRWRAWPAAYSFFCTRFMDEKSEMHYTKENWFLRKVSTSPAWLALSRTSSHFKGELGRAWRQDRMETTQ